MIGGWLECQFGGGWLECQFGGGSFNAAKQLHGAHWLGLQEQDQMGFGRRDRLAMREYGHGPRVRVRRGPRSVKQIRTVPSSLCEEWGRCEKRPLYTHSHLEQERKGPSAFFAWHLAMQRQWLGH